MSSAATWIDFFTKAGIPRSQCDNYAHIFVKNRILMNMLSELNKEYLREMGISSIGDIISILRHSKSVIESQSREKILSHHSSSDIKPKIIRIAPEPVRVSPSPATSAAAIRRVLPEHEGKYKVSLPKGSTEKSREILAKYSAMKSDKVEEKKSVFDRLQAQNAMTIKTPTKSSSASASSSSIFRRLGDYKEVDLRADKRSSGILKNSPIKKARTTVVKEKTIKRAVIRTSTSMRSDMMNHDMSSDDDMMDADNKQVSFSPKVEVREFEEDADTVASKRQSANFTGSVKSRLDLHPRAIKINNSLITGVGVGGGGGRGNIRKTIAVRPKKFSNIGTLKSDGMRQGKSVKSRLDIKKRNQGHAVSKNGSGSVFNRLNR